MGAKARGIAEMSDSATLLHKESHLLHTLSHDALHAHTASSRPPPLKQLQGLFCDQEIGNEWHCQGASSSQLAIYFRNLQCENASTKRSMAFAHVGDAFKSFLDLCSNREWVTEGKGRLGAREAMSKFFQEAVNTSSQALGLKERPIDVKISSWTPAQGDTLAVLVSVSSPGGNLLDNISFPFREKLPLQSQVQVSCSGSRVPVFPTAVDNMTWRALIPTTPLDKPGNLDIIVEITDGRHKKFKGTVEICDKEYPVESIWVQKSKLGGTRMESEVVKAVIATESEEQIWHGPFVVPSEGEITTGYGLQRFYNGVFAKGYYHRGVDYGAVKGSPVRAPANGQVALVGKESDGFMLHGNCVGLNHGQGVTSMLMHLDSAWVQEGELVRAGQVVGTVGETGLATGPHLHWGLFVHGKAVDPAPWLQEQPWL